MRNDERIGGVLLDLKSGECFHIYGNMRTDLKRPCMKCGMEEGEAIAEKSIKAFEEAYKRMKGEII